MSIESPATIVLIIANIIISIISLKQKDKYFYEFAEWPYRIVKDRKYYQIITSAFLHADFIHLFLNMFVLFSFGTFLEKFFMHIYGDLAGSLYFIFIYFTSLLFGSFLTLIFHYKDPGYVAVGASGAVSGIVFSFIIFQPLAKIYVFFFPMPAFIFAVLYVTFSIIGMRKNLGNIGHEAHLGGAVAGFISTLIIVPDAIPVFKSHFTYIIPLLF